jgi:hypothetical protein
MELNENDVQFMIEDKIRDERYAMEAYVDKEINRLKDMIYELQRKVATPFDPEG